LIFPEISVEIPEARSLIIIPFGDIQSKKEYHRLEGLVSWIKSKEERGHRVLMLGMGDYFESPSPSDRAALRAAKRGFGMYEELAKDIQDVYERATRQLAAYLDPMKGKVIGLHKGHHWMESFNAEWRDTNQLLCQLLETTYLGHDAYTTIKINGKHEFRIFSAHGPNGGGSAPGARVNRRIKMKEVQALAHWYVMAHDNDGFVYPKQTFVGREYLKQYFTGSKSLQQSYNFDEPEGTYAEEALLPPAVLGFVMCKIKVVNDGGQERLDYLVST
jgi:hypothetical protein